MITFSSHLFALGMVITLLLAFVCYLIDSFYAKSTVTAFAASCFLSLTIVFAIGCELIRWRETYIAYGVVYPPIANTYEVLVFFAGLLSLCIFYCHQRLQQSLATMFLLLPVVAMSIFLLVLCGRYQIQKIIPLSPSLQSFWMTLHVPMNFVAYGLFSIASMSALMTICSKKLSGQWLSDRLPTVPSLTKLTDLCISFGLISFTAALIVGSIWANKAWGAYWSWDPKEVWALIVWLNYVTWLHYRVMAPQRSTLLALWAFFGFWLTLFSFIGVNFYLGGLHSYGGL